MSKSVSPFKIVVGFDFSPLAELALREAAAVAVQRPGSVIHVVNVVDPTRHKISHSRGEDVDFEVEEGIKGSTEAALRAVPADGHVDIFSHALRGDAASTIVGLAEDIEADLVIVGTHGRRGLKRLLLGSTAEKVMREAGCPVLVMRPRRYDAHPELAPEPACADCVAIREETGGASWWCEVHSRPWVRPHRYSYQGGDLHPYHPDGIGPA
jgi:nucleotide-binding universal stress UspA family protein